MLIELLHHALNSKKTKPLYLIVAEAINDAIKSDILAQGDFLPSERELSLLLGISRITTRKAFEMLEQQNLITRSRGYGTFVNKTLEYSLKTPQGFSRQLILKGKKPNTIWINKTIVPATEEMSRHLHLKPNSNVFMLKRIRYANEEAVSVEESYVPTSLIKNSDEIDLSLYDYFYQQQIVPSRTKSWVSAQMPDNAFQEYIKLDKMIPILLIKQVVFDQQNQPIEYSINYCRSDMYTFVAEE